MIVHQVWLIVEDSASVDGCRDILVGSFQTWNEASHLLDTLNEWILLGYGDDYGVIDAEIHPLISGVHNDMLLNIFGFEYHGNIL